MSIPKEHEKEFAQFPAALRELVVAELAAGNEIAELGHGFPAAPCGAYIKLARKVTICARERTPALDFYDRDSSSYSGEFTDAKRHFFVLEPPNPLEPEPDMDAIRAARQAAYAATMEAQLQVKNSEPTPHLTATQPAAPMSLSRFFSSSSPVVDRFKASMAIDYEKWHDGIGYDLTAINDADPEELKAIEALLIPRKTTDWRDIEALAAIRSPTAENALKDAFETGNSEIRMAVKSYAPHLINDAQRTRSLVKALGEVEIYGGLTQTLRQVREFHPPEVIQALVRGLIERDGDTAFHFASTLFQLHGKANEPFDWGQRPVFQRFQTTDKAARAQAARDLCKTLGITLPAGFAQG